MWADATFMILTFSQLLYLHEFIIWRFTSFAFALNSATDFYFIRSLLCF